MPIYRCNTCNKWCSNSMCVHCHKDILIAAKALLSLKKLKPKQNTIIK